MQGKAGEQLVTKCGAVIQTPNTVFARSVAAQNQANSVINTFFLKTTVRLLFAVVNHAVA